MVHVLSQFFFVSLLSYSSSFPYLFSSSILSGSRTLKRVSSFKLFPRSSKSSENKGVENANESEKMRMGEKKKEKRKRERKKENERDLTNRFGLASLELLIRHFSFTFSLPSPLSSSLLSFSSLTSLSSSFWLHLLSRIPATQFFGYLVFFPP